MRVFFDKILRRQFRKLDFLRGQTGSDLKVREFAVLIAAWNSSLGDQSLNPRLTVAITTCDTTRAIDRSGGPSGTIAGGATGKRSFDECLFHAPIVPQLR